jgi:hypothetical protein
MQKRQSSTFTLMAESAIAITRHLDSGIATRSSQLAHPFSIPAIARIASFWGMARVAEMRRQLGFQHLFKRVGKQAGEATLLARSLSSMLVARASNVHHLFIASR